MSSERLIDKSIIYENCEDVSSSLSENLLFFQTYYMYSSFIILFSRNKSNALSKPLLSKTRVLHDVSTSLCVTTINLHFKVFGNGFLSNS